MCWKRFAYWLIVGNRNYLPYKNYYGKKLLDLPVTVSAIVGKFFMVSATIITLNIRCNHIQISKNFICYNFLFQRKQKWNQILKIEKHTYPNKTTHKTDCVRYQELWQEVQLDCEQIAEKKLFLSGNVSPLSLDIAI